MREANKYRKSECQSQHYIYWSYCASCFSSCREPSPDKMSLNKSCHIKFLFCFTCMFVFGSLLIHHRKHILSKNCWLQKCMCRKKIFKMVPTCRMLQLVLPCRLVKLSQWCQPRGCCVYFLHHMYSLGGVFSCCHSFFLLFLFSFFSFF